ncbi:DMT family transporter [Rhizobium sp. NTR19]|uniref:DMT family transporter n=1 Tax=Neorhizobium turbinariae TaxID=2937795 RepID=A0ABT0IWM2_9HYPH|nr:DMT family transporter [Neorhizobium turbinariae]MCK8782268.1 DMT family transporter [Neorhizobium turbinariae]
MTTNNSIAATMADRPALGIGLRILSGVLFAAMSIFVKALSDHIPVGQIVFFRSAFALIPLVIFLRLRSEFPSGLATKRPLGHLLRSGFGAAAMFASFASIARLPLAEATLLSYLSPVFTAIAGVMILSERATVWRVGGVVMGAGGVFVLVWPELGQGTADSDRIVGYGLGLLMGLLTAFALIMVRSLNRSESPGAIAFYFVVVSMLGGVASLPFGWIWADMQSMILLVLAGIFGGLAHIAMTLAFRNAEASLLAPFEYLAIVWPVLADLLIFRAPISTAFLVALPLVLAGAGLAAMDGRRRSR